MWDDFIFNVWKCTHLTHLPMAYHLFVWCVENFCGDKNLSFFCLFLYIAQPSTMFIGVGDGNMLDTNWWETRVLGVKQENNESYSMFKKISDILQLGFSKSQQILFAAALFLWPSVASCNAWLAFKCPKLQNVFVTTKKIFFSALHSPQTERSILVFVESEMEKFVERICCFGLYYCHI